MLKYLLVPAIITGMFTWGMYGLAFIFSKRGTDNGYLALAAIPVTAFPIVVGFSVIMRMHP